MKLNKTDYVLERASDGGYYAWLTVNMQCNAYGESPEEAVLNLQETMNEMIQNMHYMRDFFLTLVLYFRLSGFPIFPRRKSLQLMK